MRCLAGILLAGTAAALIAAEGAAGGAERVSISIVKPLPAVVRVKQTVVVRGTVTGRPKSARAALELQRSKRWVIAAGARLRLRRYFTLRWRVTGHTYMLVRARVVALVHGAVVTSTSPASLAIGPAAVRCAPPAPPAVAIPVGDGWIVGGVYGIGGPFPGMDACSAQPYTITATSSASGAVVASQHVAAGHSYTLVVPAGHYTLSSGACHGQAAVTAGEQTAADTDCLYP